MSKTLTAASCACVLIELASINMVAAENVPQELVGSWRAEAIGGEGVVDEFETVLEIREDGTYGGMGGCNIFTGAFTLSGKAITFGPTAAARKMCEPAVMEQEQKFFDALRNGLDWSVDGTRLTLAGADGTPVMRLVSTEAAAAGGAEVILRVPGTGAVDRQTVQYDCGGEAVDAEYINAGPLSLVTFSIGGHYIAASGIISGSGARYAGGRYIWWTEGEEATLFDVTKGEEDPGVVCVRRG